MKETRLPVRNELTASEIAVAYKHAQEILSKKFPRIKEDDFVDEFGTDEVNRAIGKVADLKKKFTPIEQRQMQRGEIFEAIFLDLLHNFWFSTLNLTRSAEFDDYFNNVDAILTKRIPNARNAIGVSIDPTTSISGLTNKKRKMDDKGGLVDIKFFQNGSNKSTLEGVPFVAVYMNDTTFTQLIRQWMSLKKTDVSEREKISIREKILHHPAQLDIIEQMRHQLKVTKAKIQAKPEKTERDLKGLQAIDDYERTLGGIYTMRSFPIFKHLGMKPTQERELREQFFGLKQVQAIFN